MLPWALSSQNVAVWRKNGLTAMSPLCHRSLWGRKVRKRLGKARPAPRLRSERAISTEVGNPTSLHTKVVLHNPVLGETRSLQAWKLYSRAGSITRLCSGSAPGQSCCGDRIERSNPVPPTGLAGAILFLSHARLGALSHRSRKQLNNHRE